jgi:hypothetical protein
MITLCASSFGVKPFDAGKKGNKPEVNNPREELVKLKCIITEANQRIQQGLIYS